MHDERVVWLQAELHRRASSSGALIEVQVSLVVVDVSVESAIDPSDRAVESRARGYHRDLAGFSRHGGETDRIANGVGGSDVACCGCAAAESGRKPCVRVDRGLEPEQLVVGYADTC